MCASYGALESTFVSTRSTVPDTLASAAARTLAATSPVRSFSVLPLAVCPPFDGSCCCWAGGVDDADGVADGDVAALAIAPPLTAAAATAAAVTSLDLMPCIRILLGSLADTGRASRLPLRRPGGLAENQPRVTAGGRATAGRCPDRRAAGAGRRPRSRS